MVKLQQEKSVKSWLELGHPQVTINACSENKANPNIKAQK